MPKRIAGSYLTRKSQKTDPLDEALDVKYDDGEEEEKMDPKEMVKLKEKVMEARKRKGKKAKSGSFTME